jgi:hypothetical protein
MEKMLFISRIVAKDIISFYNPSAPSTSLLALDHSILLKTWWSPSLRQF